MVEKHFNISIAPARSRGGSLVHNKYLLLWDKMYAHNIKTSAPIGIEPSLSLYWTLVTNHPARPDYTNKHQLYL
jgi:hypothetical protein